MKVICNNGYFFLKIDSLMEYYYLSIMADKLQCVVLLVLLQSVYISLRCLQSRTRCSSYVN